MKLEGVTHEDGEGGFWILPFLAVSFKQQAFVLWFGWLYWMWGLWFNGATPPSGRYGTKSEQQPTEQGTPFVN